MPNAKRIKMSKDQGEEVGSRTMAHVDGEGRSAWRIKGVITGSNHDKKQTLLRMRLKGSRQKRRAEDMCMTPKHFWGPVCCFRWSYIAAVAHTGSTSIWLSIGKDS